MKQYNKKALCLVKQWIDVACYTCEHYYERMSERSHYYPYMGVPSCRLGSEQRELCHTADFEKWSPVGVHSVLGVVER